MLETRANLRHNKQRFFKQETQNKEDSPSKKPILPGTYHEDEAEEEMKIIVSTKYKDKNTTRKETFEGTESKETENFEQQSETLIRKMFHHKAEKKEIIKDNKKSKPKLAIENVMQKILERKINLTREEILSVSPSFIHRLQGIFLEEKEAMESIRNLEIEEDFLSIKNKEFEKQRVHYACPLGFMQSFVGNKEYLVTALVNTGAEINIITEYVEIKASPPIRKLEINLRGIVGHTTSLMGPAEVTQVLFPSGEEEEIHFFISKGEVHIVLGRPFLGDHEIRLENVGGIDQQKSTNFKCI
ncbi:hypothetical protein O181_085985 [Austropuccinia psidii MF-1]|uniref:Peptidase A2 domain-containing protein n=1 Tax=Austropuccinia psidii MF-1 TaxID=1389203 RepID=A0A9Q3FTC2_9BASI|nr:hypothetical protein [Austropuccinia psidii MF-1]